MRYMHSLQSMSMAKMDGKLKKTLDYINIIIKIVEHILSWDGPENDKEVKIPYIVINSTNKMKRVFIVKNNQIISFSFPFNIFNKSIENNEIHSKWHVGYKDIDISTLILSKIREIYNDYKEACNNKKLYKDILFDLDNMNDDIEKAIRIFEMLMITEPAYIRYDYDHKHADKKKHPLHHFDFNFIKEYHYKIGLNNNIDLLNIEDLMNKETDCWFIDKDYTTNKKTRLKTFFEKHKGKKKSSKNYK